MAFCIKCGQKLREGANFCDYCGTPTSADMSDNQSERRTVYEGKIHKCPNCGEVLNSFTSVCPSCGYEIRDSLNSEAIKAFASKLLNAGSYQEQISVIRNFPIPNTKEDIYDFMILASGNIGDNPEDELSAAWQSKIEQAYQKARLVFKDEKEFNDFLNIYNQVCAKLNKVRKIQKSKKIKTTVSELVPALPNLIIVAGWLISVFILIPMCGINTNRGSANNYQVIITLDFIVGMIFIPFALRCQALLPKLTVSFGLVLSIVLLIPLCGRNLNKGGTNMFQLILIFDILCSMVIIIRMLVHRNKKPKSEASSNIASFVISLICVGIFFAAYGVGNIITVNKNKENQEAELEAVSITYEWPESGLNTCLPKPPTPYGKITKNDEASFSMDVYQVTLSQFTDFVNACKEKGFTINVVQSDSFYYAYNEEQYDLDVMYFDSDDTLSIFLSAPLEMSDIKWPDSELVNQIPVPESLTGNIKSEDSEHFCVYIANTTPEQYTEYVDKCMDEGFTIDYSKSDTKFHAYNKAGYYLEVNQEVFDKMYINIKVPEKN